ncbi:MAG TPA: beta-glucuronidase, partial [Blastocatellia bacterium]|nr:beta-glucuronidase [Blastocatellia bacterium]
MKSLFGALLLLATVSTAHAQSPNLIINAGGRKTTSLDGQWQAIVDPFENGYYDYRYKPGKNGYFKNAKPRSASDLVEYNFDTAQQLSVPGDWN